METQLIYTLFASEKQGTLSKEDQEVLQKLLENNAANQQLYSELNFIWESSNQLPQPDTDASWEHLRATIQVPAKKVSLFTSPAFIKYAAAAVVLFMGLGYLLLPYFGSNRTLQLVALQGEVKEVDLSDGTHVILNQNSSLQFKEENGKRLANLTGEAYFVVAKDASKPFVIVSPNAETEVLGTQFHLVDRVLGELSLLEVNEGKVKFSNTKENVLVVGGEKAVMSPSGIQKEKLEQSFNAALWSKGELALNNQSMSEVLVLLKSKYNATFEVSNPQILTCKFSGTFKKETLEEAVNIISLALNTEYVISDSNKVLFKGEGCK